MEWRADSSQEASDVAGGDPLQQGASTPADRAKTLWVVSMPLALGIKAPQGVAGHAVF